MADSRDLFDLFERGESEALLAALDTGGDAKARDRWGCSLLYYAAGKGDLALIDGLLQRGAEVERSSDAGNTPLMIAAARGHLDVVKRLLAAGASATHNNRWGFDAHKWADWSPKATEIQAELFAAAK